MFFVIKCIKSAVTGENFFLFILMLLSLVYMA